jgi:hypothetical protein
MGDLIRHVPPPDFAPIAELHGITTWFHHGSRLLIVTLSMDRYDLRDAHASQFGIRTWRHAAISVQGALKVRLEDQKRIGRQRRGGERSPAPLPDWYELSHLAYDHAVEVGFDPERAIWQYLPPSWEPKLNIAEALHLRQPA